MFAFRVFHWAVILRVTEPPWGGGEEVLTDWLIPLTGAGQPASQPRYRVPSHSPRHHHHHHHPSHHDNNLTYNNRSRPSPLPAWWLDQHHVPPVQSGPDLGGGILLFLFGPDLAWAGFNWTLHCQHRCWCFSLIFYTSFASPVLQSIKILILTFIFLHSKKSVSMLTDIVLW